MKGLKSISLVICVIFLAASLAACSPSGTGDNKENEVKVWKFAHIRPAGSVSDLDFQAFAKDVENRSNGSLKLEIYPASQLGDYTVVQERVSIGDIHMQVAPVGTNLDKSFGITSAPYLVENWNQARKVYASDSKLNTAMAEILDKNGMKLIAVYPLYFGGIALVKEPKEPGNADVPKNIKIRVPPIKSFEKTAEALGYIATPLPFAETFTAMQTGIVEGAIGAGAEGYYSNFKDLVKWYLPLNDHFEMWYMYVNKEEFNKLSPEQQKALLDAAKAMEEKRFRDAEQQEKEFEGKLAAEGIKIVEFTDAELAAFAKKTREQVWPLVKGDYGEKLFESIVKEIQ
ncbi:MAG: TRAP-type C4-dicarboxylate transport system, periplasmic component [Firmicutes bacterium]|nr:TRAP-type C4-dicarboxylate transport system, periplasmic component [Bacillota bacterium]